MQGEIAGCLAYPRQSVAQDFMFARLHSEQRPL